MNFTLNFDKRIHQTIEAVNLLLECESDASNVRSDLFLNSVYTLQLIKYIAYLDKGI